MIMSSCVLGGYCGSHHVVLPLLLLHDRDLTNRGHAHHHRLDTGQIRQEEVGVKWWKCGKKEHKVTRKACRNQPTQAV